MQYRASPYRWVVLALCSFSYLLAYVHRMCPAVLAGDLMHAFDASAAITGLLASAYFYPYAMMQAPGGVIADRLGPRRLVTLSMLVATLGSALFAVSGGVMAAFWARVLVGLGVSVVLVPSYKALTAWFPAKDYVMGTSLVIAVAGLGGVLAGSPLAWLSEQIGWRGSFLVIAGITLVNGIMVWLFVRDRPQDKGLPPVEPEPRQSGQPLQKVPVRQALAMVLGSLDFWLLAIWFFLNGGILFSFAGLWAGPYYMQVYGMSKVAAGNAINLLSVGWVIGPLIFIWIAARVSSRPLVLAASTGFWALLMIWVLMRNGSMNLAEIYVWNILFAVMGAGPAGVCFAAAKERFPLEVAGTVTGLIYMFPMAGSTVLQPLAGLILDSSGNMSIGLTSADFTPLFLLYLAASTLATVAVLAFKTRRGSNA